jgi:hypothetical protein
MRDYATKSATSTMEAFADYLIAEVYGGELPAGMDVESFRRGVALGGSTRMDFQKSDFWKKDSRNYLANVGAGRAAREAEKERKAEETARKATERLAAIRAANAARSASETPVETPKPAAPKRSGSEGSGRSTGSKTSETSAAA